MSFADATGPETHRGVFHNDDGKNSEEDQAVLSSPVPLSQEESENEEVRALAAKLAPTLLEVDNTLTKTATLSESTSVNNLPFGDDDDIDEEVRNLQQSEEIMRQELAMAMDFDHFMNFTSWEEPEVAPIVSLQTPGRRPQETAEADVDDGTAVEEACNTPLQPIRIPSAKTPDYSSATTPSSSTLQSPGFWSGDDDDSHLYRHSDHMQALKLVREEHGCWYSVDWTPQLQMRLPPEAGPVVQEYCLAIPQAKLQQVFVGIAAEDSSNPEEVSVSASSSLPVRTLTMRIRPDVLCGAVMEGVNSAVSSMENAVVQKRQGGHLQALLEGSYWVDFRLATEKSEVNKCARKLIIRIHHVEHNGTQSLAESDGDEETQGDAEEETFFVDGLARKDAASKTTSLHLRECAALIQRMEAPVHARKRIHLPATSQSMQEAVSEHLLEHYRACPSVRKGHITLPALNADDFAVIKKSWSLIEAVWEELDTRDLAYSTLECARFGAFPALPTLDVHYCSQLRRISREEMVGQLLKSASQLEEYAREAEYACANMISILHPTFEAYGAEEPDLPEAIPLATYPLDYTAPQVSCPPWGLKVQHALNEIPAWNDDPPPDSENSPSLSFEMAEKAVAVVLEAFSKQDDEEQSARLQRKNAQVMDRLDRMLQHEKQLVERLSTCMSSVAAKAARELHLRTSLFEVPVLKWNIVAGSGAGTVSVTSTHIVFATQLIPVVGEITVKSFSLQEVDMSVEEAAPSLLKPFPTVVTLKNRKTGEEVYSFRLSSGGTRLKSLVFRLKENPLLSEIPPYPIHREGFV